MTNQKFLKPTLINRLIKFNYSKHIHESMDFSQNFLLFKFNNRKMHSPIPQNTKGKPIIVLHLINKIYTERQQLTSVKFNFDVLI